MEKGVLKRRDRTNRSLLELLQRYEAEVLPFKRTDSNESYMLRVIGRDPMSRKQLQNLTSADFAKFRDNRLKTVKPASVVRQIGLLRHALGVANREWGWDTPLDELAKITLPRLVVNAIPRINDHEVESLLSAAGQQRNVLVSCAVRIALGTAMRRSEILNLTWADVDLRKGTITIRMSKNGRPRCIPITPTTKALLAGITVQDQRVIPMSENALRLGFERARKKAGTVFRFHDLRHEAISRLFELGLTIPEVQLISGHSTLSQLSRYSHPDAKRIADKLAELC